MKTFYGLILYMSMGGFLMGFEFNDIAEKCGHPIKYTNDFALASLAWPSMLITALVVDEDNLVKSECK